MIFERLRQFSEAHTRLKDRIHNVKLPVRNKRALFLLKCFYGTAPIVAGYYVMQWIAPDEKAIKAKLLEMEARDPEAYARAKAASDENRRGLQEVRPVERQVCRTPRSPC